MVRPNPQAEKAEICERIADGQSLAEICRSEHMPKKTLVYEWLRDDKAFAEDYARARETQADSDADAINDIADKVLRGEIEPQAARVAIDAKKWAAGVRKPSKYGPKLELAGDADKPLMVTTVKYVVSDPGAR